MDHVVKNFLQFKKLAIIASSYALSKLCVFELLVVIQLNLRWMSLIFYSLLAIWQISKRVLSKYVSILHQHAQKRPLARWRPTSLYVYVLHTDILIFLLLFIRLFLKNYPNYTFGKVRIGSHLLATKADWSNEITKYIYFKSHFYFKTDEIFD